jgi:hypothetical protein
MNSLFVYCNSSTVKKSLTEVRSATCRYPVPGFSSTCAPPVTKSAHCCVYRYFTVIRRKGYGVYIIISSRTVHVPVCLCTMVYFTILPAGFPGFREARCKGAGGKKVAFPRRERYFTRHCTAPAPAVQQRKQQKETR